MPRPTSRPRKPRQPELGADGTDQVVWLRIDRADYEKLRERQIATGATVAAQIRIFIRDALKGRVIK